MELGDIVISSAHWWDKYHIRRCIMHPPSFSNIHSFLIQSFEDLLYLMVTHLGDGSNQAHKKIINKWGAHALFSFLKYNYEGHLTASITHIGDDAIIKYNYEDIGKTIFLDKNVTYVDVVYINYFIYLEILVVHYSHREWLLSRPLFPTLDESSPLKFSPIDGRIPHTSRHSQNPE